MSVANFNSASSRGRILRGQLLEITVQDRYVRPMSTARAMPEVMRTYAVALDSVAASGRTHELGLDPDGRLFELAERAVAELEIVASPSSFSASTLSVHSDDMHEWTVPALSHRSSTVGFH
jgi:hypothetical protein